MLDDADLGCSEDTVANFEAGLHDYSNCAGFSVRFVHCEDCLVQLWVEFLALGVVLDNVESREAVVHGVGGQLLAFQRCF